MDIRFCDICNESIAQIHFDEGRAIARPDGVRCVASPSGSGAPPAPVAGGEGAIWIAALAMLVAGWIGWLAMDATERTERSIAQAGASDSAVLEAALVELRETSLASRTAADDGRAALLAEIAALRADERAGRVRVEELAATTQSLLSELEDRLASFESELDTRTADPGLTELSRSIEGLRGDVEVLAGAVLAGLEGVTQTQPVPAAPQPETPGNEWTVKLGDSDPVTRWSAVDQLARSGDARNADLLIPLLADPDLLVRMSVARALGTLDNPTAIPSLIESLADGEPPVREAAMVALRQLTDRSFGFDPVGDANARERSIESWRKWWDKAGSEKFEIGSQP